MAPSRASSALPWQLQLARLRTPSPGIDYALQELHELAATVRGIAHGIHPATLAEHGLAPALESLLDTTNDIPVTLHVDQPVGRLDEAVEILAYEMIQEGLANADAHGARSAEVSVAIVDGGLRVDLTGRWPRRRLSGSRRRTRGDRRPRTRRWRHIHHQLTSRRSYDCQAARAARSGLQSVAATVPGF